METTRFQGTVLRQASAEDASVLCTLMRELAEFEGVAEEMHTEPEGLRKTMEDPKGPQALLCETDGEKREPVGFAIYSFSFSSFTGKLTLYIDDLYVREPYRGKGIGRRLFSAVAGIAADRDCGRVDWYCMKSNVSGRDYYDRKLRAEMVDWLLVYRLDEGRLRRLAREVEDGSKMTED